MKRYEDHDLMYDPLFFCAGCSNDDEMISEDHKTNDRKKNRDHQERQHKKRMK